MPIGIESIQVRVADLVNHRLAVLADEENYIVEPGEPVWQIGIDPHSASGMGKNPVAFIFDRLDETRLTVNVKKNGDLTPGIYTLNGYFGTREFNQTNKPGGKTIPPFFTGSIEVDENGSLKETEVYVEIRFNPRTFMGTAVNFSWELVPPDSNGDERQWLDDLTYLELYWLYDGDFQMFSRGIPVALLRYLASFCRIFYLHDNTRLTEDDCGIIYQWTIHHQEFPAPSIEDVKAWAVQACFHRNPPRYDVFHTHSHFSYTYLQGEPRASVDVLLTQYLASLYDDSALCDCNDQAAFLLLYLAAAGIGGVNLAVLSPFGYLKLNGLAGRGLCNNPVYKNNRLEKITRQRMQSRAGFRSHTFCLSPSRENNRHMVLDACVGPYTGNDCFHKYVRQVCDNLAPDGSNQIELMPEPKVYDPRLYVDFLSRTPHVKDFTTISVAPPGYSVVCRWPSPTACPALDSGWEIAYDNITPGDVCVLQTWVIKRKAEYITVKLYVFSHPDHKTDASPVKDLFQTITTTTILEKNNKTPQIISPPLGDMVCSYTHHNRTRHIWVPTGKKNNAPMVSNVIFDVTCTNINFNHEALLIWLDQIAYAHKESDVEGCFPDPECISVGPPANDRNGGSGSITMLPGERLPIQLIGSNDGTILDFKPGPAPLRLTSRCRTGCFITFTALSVTQTTTSTMTFILIDTTTLLSSKKNYTVTVKPKPPE